MKLLIVISSVVVTVLTSLLMQYLGVIGNLTYFFVGVLIGLIGGILLVMYE